MFVYVLIPAVLAVMAGCKALLPASEKKGDANAVSSLPGRCAAETQKQDVKTSAQPDIYYPGFSPFQLVMGEKK